MSTSEIRPKDPETGSFSLSIAHSEQRTHMNAPKSSSSELSDIYQRIYKIIGEQAVKPHPNVVYGILFVNQIIFAGLHVFSKPALTYFQPFVFASMRILVAIPFIYWLAKKEGGLPHVTSKDTTYLVVLGLVGVCMPQGLIFVGNKLAGPAIVAIFQPSIPVWVSVLCAILKLEKMTWGKGVGVASAVGGALLLLGVDSVNEANSTATTRALGILIMVCQTVSYSCYLVMLQWKLKTLPYPITIFYHAMKWGWAFVTLVALTQVSSTRWSEAPLYSWLAIIYCGVVASFVAHSANSWAVRHVAAVTPSLFTCMQPFLSLLGASLVLGMTFSWRDMGGLVLILAGVLTVIYIKAQEMKRASAQAAVAQALESERSRMEMSQGEDHKDHLLGTSGRDASDQQVFSFTTIPIGAYNTRTPLDSEDEIQPMTKTRSRSLKQPLEGTIEEDDEDSEQEAPPRERSRPAYSIYPPSSSNLSAMNTNSSAS